MMDLLPSGMFKKWWLFIIAMLASVSSTALATNQTRTPEFSPSLVEVTAWVGESSAAPPSHDAEEETRIPQFSVNEQVVLYIDVSTPRWFTGGTRIQAVEIADVLAKQRNPLATNYTQRKGATTWSHQRWEVTLYPQSAGVFVIPSLAVKVKVSLPEGGSRSGTVVTQPIRFEAKLPSNSLNDETPWLAASELKATQSWALSTAQETSTLKVGDAITRTIKIEASDTLSVLIPDLLAGELAESYQSYPQPHRLEDTHQRGDYRSCRIEQTVYVVQQGGALTLPEHSFQWWDTDSRQLKTVTLASQTYHAKHTLASFMRAYKNGLIALGGFVVILVVIIIAVRRYFHSHAIPPWYQFRRLIKAGQWGKVRALIYQRLRVERGELELSKARADRAWQEKCQRFEKGEESVSLFNQLWRAVKAKTSCLWARGLPKALPELSKIHAKKQDR
ncbi:BatD family protein [Vibrio renipiscarius]|uniref:BatD family protein n=1 Tax=Vibrio renipiscarius TaxID=1461322 RepID=UPI000AB1B527|nr:BatD family protein [Vibrio renipiscarius]